MFTTLVSPVTATGVLLLVFVPVPSSPYCLEAPAFRPSPTGDQELAGVAQPRIDGGRHTGDPDDGHLVPTERPGSVAELAVVVVAPATRVPTDRDGA